SAQEAVCVFVGLSKRTVGDRWLIYEGDSNEFVLHSLLQSLSLSLSLFLSPSFSLCLSLSLSVSLPCFCFSLAPSPLLHFLSPQRLFFLSFLSLSLSLCKSTQT